MAGMGRIREDTITAVRERTNIEDVIGRYVTLKKAGPSSLKGLCPFHDEKSPSFQVTPARGYYFCFGCSEGGDVITFLQKIEHLKFFEAVEMLADQSGVEIQYDGGDDAPTAEQRAAARGQRQRLVDAHVAAAAFYQQQLLEPDAAAARQFLADRGFEYDAATQFGCGYSPDSWDATVNHLRRQGFSNEDLIAAGLASEGRRGPVDRFRGRLMWPIRDISGEIVGFGARKLHDHDDGPKYLNTPETVLYKKSRVLFGLDAARKAIAKNRQAVVVEGYTDVMACHLSGITTAVATCGTAFGEEHIRVLRRLLSDDDALHGEVIFTFDGDSAGQKAALRAFEFDDKFQARTSVAVAQEGMDPCELRLIQGPEAVQALIASRQPLFSFAIRTSLSRYDLRTPEGRAQAAGQAAPILAKIRERNLRGEYIRLVAKWTGLEYGTLDQAVTQAERGLGSRNNAATPPNKAANPVEREVLRVLLQQPVDDLTVLDLLDHTSFSNSDYQVIWHHIRRNLLTRDHPGLVETVRQAVPEPQQSLVLQLAVEDCVNSRPTADLTVVDHARTTLEEALRRVEQEQAQDGLTPERENELADLAGDLTLRLLDIRAKVNELTA